MTRQLGSGQIFYIAEVKFKVAKIKKMVDELYDQPFIPTLVVVDMELAIYVENIWEIQDPLENTQERRKKRKHQSAQKEVVKKANKDSLQCDQDWQVRVEEMKVGSGSLKSIVIMMRRK